MVYEIIILKIFNNFKVYAGGGGVFEKVFDRWQRGLQLLYLMKD